MTRYAAEYPVPAPPSRARQAYELFVRGFPVEARRVLSEAAALRMLSVAELEELGFVAAGTGEHERSRHFYAEVVAAAPRDALARYNLATACRNLGQLDEAEQACDRALSLDSGLAQAALLRAHLRVQTPAHNHVDALRQDLRRTGLTDTRAIFIHYALGKELEDLGDHDAAFGQYCSGAGLRRATLRYAVDEDVRKLARIREVFSQERLRDAPALDDTVRDAFIMGLPRSGTTLLERVLTGHPTVASNGETDSLMKAMLEAMPTAGTDVFDRVSRADPAATVAAYRRRSEPSSACMMVVEKLPLNYLYAGALRLTMPQARAVLVMRAPADNALAMYSTLFGSGYPFSYDLDELASYIIGYRALIDHWAATIGDQLLPLDYQAFVAAPAAQGERVAAHFGMTWQAGMTAIERNRSASATASAAQVRRPIYRSSVARSRAFGRHLDGFRARLERAGIDPEEGIAPIHGAQRLGKTLC